MKKIALTLLATTLGITPLLAADKTKEFVTHTELGYIQTNGNTDTKTFNLDSKIERTWDKHVGSLKVAAQYAKSNDITSKKKYELESDYNYKINSKISFTYLVGYKYDAFSGLDYQFYTGPGAKYNVLKDLSVEASILYSEDNYIVGDTVSYAAYRLKSDYTKEVSKNLKFLQMIELKGSFDETDNYFVTSKSALTSKISDKFSAGVSYKIDYVNTPVSGKDDIDTTLSLNLIMDY